MADDIRPSTIPEPLTATLITNDEPVSSRIPAAPGRQPDVAKRRVSETAEKITYFVALLAGSASSCSARPAAGFRPPQAPSRRSPSSSPISRCHGCRSVSA